MSSRYRRWCQHLGDGQQGEEDGHADEGRRRRQIYHDLKRDLTIAPDGSYPNEMQDGDIYSDTSPSSSKRRTAPPLEVNNPLSLSDNNPWHTYFESLAMLDQIKIDVQRAFPDEDALHLPIAQSHLTRILFVWSLIHENLHVGYRQGMHELAAICWLVRMEDGVEAQDGGQLEADTFHLYVLLMKRVRPWYEWKNHVRLPISLRCEAINTLLVATDTQLASHLATIGVETQLFAIRWLRLLFTREMPLDMGLKLWDSMFMKDPSLKLADAICVAMLIRTRSQLLCSDYPNSLQALLNYPEYALQASPSTLVVQAKLIQDSSTRETLMTLIQANEEMLTIPSITPQNYNHSLPTSYGSSVPSLPPSLSHLTKGLTAQTLSAGFGRALCNVQRSVNAAYTAHAGANGNANGFPPSFETLSRSYSVGGGQESTAELERLRGTNKKMGESMTRVIAVLEKHWVDNVAPNDEMSIERKGERNDEEEFLRCLTTLKHTRDVLCGNATDFDSTIMDNPKVLQSKKDTKGKEFGDRFKRTVEVDSVIANPARVSMNPVMKDTKPVENRAPAATRDASAVPYTVRKAKLSHSGNIMSTPAHEEANDTRQILIDDPLGATHH